jgi:hypothetical protein
MSKGVTLFLVQVVDLFLQKVNHGVALENLSITLQDLHLQVSNGSIPPNNSLTKRMNLVIFQGKIPMKILGQIHHIIHTPLLK